jgi:hypothetical protein
MSLVSRSLMAAGRLLAPRALALAPQPVRPFTDMVGVKRWAFK